MTDFKVALKDSHTRTRDKIHRLKARVQNRYVHRSFKMTRRRDYRPLLRLPKLWKFTAEVQKVLWAQRINFLILALIYAILGGILIGLASQEDLKILSSTVSQATSDISTGAWAQIGNATAVLAGTLGSIFSSSSDTNQTIYAVVLGLLVWLTSVWLVRAYILGKKIKLRDALYNAGSPIVAMFVVSLVIVVELLPLGLAIIGGVTAVNVGLLDFGVQAMLIWVAIVLLGLLSIYWVTASLLAMAIVTIPGMYPLRAVGLASKIVYGRRIQILLRIFWMLLLVVLAWAVVMIPLIILDNWLNGIWSWFGNVPFIPIMILIMTTITLIWSSSYLYLLFRKIADNDDLGL